MAFLLRACAPPKYFLPVRTHNSCFARTSNFSQACLAVPSLKYLWDIFSNIAAANSRVEPFHGSCLRQVTLGAGRTVLRIFSLVSSSIVFALFSSTGFRNPSGTFSWTNGLTAPLMTAIKVVLSVTLANVVMSAHTSERCLCACAAWLKMSPM